MPAAKKSTQAREKRLSREQETWDNIAIHDIDVEVDGTFGPLPNIKARDGMAQRWMRTMKNGHPDPANIAKMENRHWRHRSPDTVPQNVAAPTSYVDGLGDTIGISGSVLVERPLSIHTAYAAEVRKRTQSQARSVDESLFNDTASSGFGSATAVENKSVAKVGSGVMPVDD